MSRYFQVGALHFYPLTNEVHNGEEVFKVRPKTSELLTVLLEANGEIVSKNDLLKAVWQDVIVEEHVIFQSITELRKIFGESPIIKTHPRKGYSVTATVVCKQQSHKDVTPPSILKKLIGESHLKRQHYLLISIALVLICFVVFYGESQRRTESKFTNTGSVVVLPVTNRIMGAENSWVRYGGMDLLIKYLQQYTQAPVLPTDMVLDTLKRAGINIEQIDEDAMTRLFEVSGAEIIVDHTISGSSGDYQLVYSIYEKESVIRGALFAEQANALFWELNAILMKNMGVTAKQPYPPYQYNFKNELMAAAIDQMQYENYDKAVTLFKALLVKEPENLMANQLLTKSLVHLGKFAEAEQVSSKAIDIAITDSDEKNLGRLYFWKALSLTQQHKYLEALSVMAQAKTKAERTDDVLYLANAARVKGKVYLLQQQFEQARQEIAEALAFYTSIHEPYGQSTMYIDLGELELALGHREQAKAAFEKALTLGEKSKLEQIIEQSRRWLETVAQH